MKSIKLLAFFAAAATISVSCGGSDTDQPEPPKRGNLLLTASKDAITSNGTDAVTFNVEMTEEGGEKIDVTGQATIYLAGKDACLRTRLPPKWKVRTDSMRLTVPTSRMT